MMNWSNPNAAKSSLQSALLGLVGRVLRNQGDQVDQCAKCNAPVERKELDPCIVLRGRYEEGRIRVHSVRVDPDDPIAILPDDFDPKRKGWMYQCPECGQTISAFVKGTTGTFLFAHHVSRDV